MSSYGLHGRAGPRRHSVIMRFFCGRKGAAAARMLISFWSIFGTVFVSGTAWVLKEALDEFKAVRAGVVQIQQYTATDAERWRALREDLSEVKTTAHDLADRVNGIDVRLARQEGHK